MCHYLELNSFSINNVEELSQIEIENILLQVPPYCAVSFSGGEPLVRKDIMNILSQSSAKFKTHIITNGTMIDVEKARKLVGIGCRNTMSKGLLLVGVSVEGPEEVHDAITGIKGSFGKTVEGLERLLEQRREAGKKFPLVSLQMVITAKNAAYIDWVFSLGERMGVDICNYMVQNNAPDILSLHRMSPSAILSKHLEVDGVDVGSLSKKLSLLEERKGRSTVQLRFSPFEITPAEVLRYYSRESEIGHYECRSPWSRFVIDPFGDLWICPFVSVGNLRTRSLMGLWNSKEARKFRADLKKNRIFPGCAGCCSSIYVGKG